MSEVGGGHYSHLEIQPGTYAEMNRLSFYEGEVVKRLSVWRRAGDTEELLKAYDEVAKLVAMYVCDRCYGERMYRGAPCAKCEG